MIEFYYKKHNKTIRIDSLVSFLNTNQQIDYLHKKRKKRADKPFKNIDSQKRQHKQQQQ